MEQTMLSSYRNMKRFLSEINRCLAKSPRSRRSYGSRLHRCPVDAVEARRRYGSRLRFTSISSILSMQTSPTPCQQSPRTRAGGRRPMRCRMRYAWEETRRWGRGAQVTATLEEAGSLPPLPRALPPPHLPAGFGWDTSSPGRRC